MRKIKKRLLPFFMAMIMLLGLLPTTAFAADVTMDLSKCEVSWDYILTDREGKPFSAAYGLHKKDNPFGYAITPRLRKMHDYTAKRLGLSGDKSKWIYGQDYVYCFCIEHGIPLPDDTSYAGSSNATHGNKYEMMSDDQKNLLTLALMYGYPNRTDIETSKDANACYSATQLIVWQITLGWRTSPTSLNDKSYPASGYTGTATEQYCRNPHLKEFYDRILTDMADHFKRPSFTSALQSTAPTYEMKFEGGKYTVTLTDTNNVLQKFYVSANNGISVSSSGNKLTLSSSKPIMDEVQIKLNRRIPSTNHTTTFLIWSVPGKEDKNQDMVSGVPVNNDPVPAYLRVKAPAGHIRLIKTSEDGKVGNVPFHISGNGIDKDIRTQADGTLLLENLRPGIYEVTEQTENRYEPQTTKRVTVVSGQTATVTFNNTLKRGDLSVTKTAEDGFVEGKTFHLYGTSLSGMTVNEYAVTDSRGIAVFEDVLISGSTPYTLEEVGVEDKYVVPEKQQAPIEWNKVTNKSFHNILKKWNLTVTKSDSENGAAQGNGSLAGAKYGIYKGEQLIDSYTTDINGQFTTKYYVCGDDWSVCEIEPSEGYLLNTQAIHIGAEAKNYTAEFNIAPPLDSYETVKKGNIAIIKHTNDGSTQIETPEVGAEFEVYLKKSGSYANAKDSERDNLICDEHGFAQTKNLPYGVYTVHQTKGWDGREMLPDFDVFISEDGQTYRYLANNANFQSYIKVVKTDAESGLTIPYAGAAFQLYDPDGNKIVMSYTYPEYTETDTFYTAEDGTLITPQKLDYGKDYSLVEVSAPYGYVLDSTPVYFDVAADTATEDGAITVVKVNRPNMPQKGVIKITKTGEVFWTVTEQGGIYQPVYETNKLSGAVFEIRAAEDIYTLDGVLHYTKGEVVDTVTTGTDGLAVSRPLYLGKYEIQEITAPHSMVLNGEIQKVELTYAGQEISVTEVSGSLYNERQKVKVSLDKELEQNDLFGIGGNNELANITFGLYAAEDILATDGTKIPKDGLIEIISFDADGHAVCQTDLPLGKYYLQERSTDSHYILNDAKFPFEFTYAGQDIETVEIAANNGEAIANNLKYGSVSGIKVDEDGKTIAGAKFGLFRNDETAYTEENALMTTVSDKNGFFRFDNIPVGVWVVRELVPAQGFVLNEQAYQVTITEDEQIIEIKLENRYIRSDILGHKVDEDGRVISGALFGLFKDDTEEFTEDNAFMIAESDESGFFRFNQIRYGKWIVKELRPAAGFVPNEKLYEVTVSENGTVIEFTVENEYIRGNIEGLKVDEDGNTIEGAVFGLFEPGTEEFTEQNAVMTAISGKDGKFLFENVRYGKWIVKELSCPEQYVLSDEVFEVTIEMDGMVLPLTAVNKYVTGRVQVIKISSMDHDKLLSGAEFEIYLDVNGNQVFDPGIDTLVGKMTENEAGFYEMDGLKYNGYFLFESKSPDGFQKDDRYFYFQISADGETVMVENEKGVGFVNEPVPHTPGNPSSPQTGDQSHIMLWILLASGSFVSIIILSVVSRKKHKSL